MGTTMGSITARLSTDNSQFDASMQRSGELAGASARSRAIAAKQAAGAEALSAKLAGDTISQYALKQVAARKAVTEATADYQKASKLARDGYGGEQASANLLAAALQRLNTAKTASIEASMAEARATEVSTHATVSQMMATSAAVRTLDGNPGIRATERFLTTIPGVGKALLAAFPVIGGIAFGAMIVEMGSKVVEFIKNVQKMPQAIEQGFASLNLAQHTVSDELDLATDKIQNELDKLAKKPENNLKVAFDEAKLAADRFAASIESSNAKMDELLSKNHISGLAVLTGMFGTVSTASREGTVKAFSRQADSNAYDLADATARGDQAGVAKARKALLDTQNAELAEARKNLKAAQDADTGPAPVINQLMGARAGHDRPNNAAVIADDKGIITTILNQQRQDAAQTLNTQKQAELQIANDKKAAEEERKKAAAEALAARKAATAAAIQQANEAHQAWEAVQDRSKGDEVAYWATQLANVKAGSGLYNAELKKSNEAIIALHREESEAIANFTREYLADFNEPGGGTGISDEDKESQKSYLKSQGDGAKDYSKSLKAMKDAPKANAEAIAKASIQMQVTTGNMTKLAAAQAVAALHAQEYQDAVDSLNDAKANVDALPEGTEKDAQLNNIKISRTRLDTNYAIQTQQDQNSINPPASSALVGATDALRDFALAAQDSAAQVRKFIDTALGGFNAQVIRGVSGQRTSFGSYGAGLARTVGTDALQKGEGSLLSMMGLGPTKKPTGSVGDPTYTVVTNMPGGGVGLFGDAAPPLAMAPFSGLATQTNPFAAFLPGGSGAGGSSMTSSHSGLGGGIPGFFNSFLNGKPAGGGGNSTISSAADAGGDDSGIVTSIAQDATDLGSFAGMFASGGTVGPNMWGIVGENGPEPIFGGRTGATVLPNKSLRGIGGGDTYHYHNHIDATGSTDTAATEAAVNRGLAKHGPAIAVMALKAMHEQRMRSPSGGH